MTAAATLAALLLLGADPAFKCKGEKPKDARTQQLRQNVEAEDLYKLAVKQLGAAKSCAVKWTRNEDRDFFTLTYQFEKGSAEFDTFPPETSVRTLSAPGGFPDEAALKDAFKNAEDVKQFKIDFTKKPEVTTEKGEKTETFSSPEDDGDNAMVDFTTNQAGKLIKASFHFAL
jgi:hypothetical protein